VSIDKVVNFLYDTWGTPKQENIDAMTQVIEAWENGHDVYVKDKFGGGVWIKAPVPTTKPAGPSYPMPVPVYEPDWTCGCGTTLHGDEAACWRCGAKPKCAP
jgi:hypothetical protein